MSIINPDLYPSFHVNFVKGKHINEVPTVRLADLGLPYDIEYPGQSFEDIPDKLKKDIEDEFIFLIEQLLPRNIRDLFYKIALEPEPAYWTFFDQAANRMGLTCNQDNSASDFGQYNDFVKDGISNLLDEGRTPDWIYENTCAIRTMINDIVRETRYYERMREKEEQLQAIDEELELDDSDYHALPYELIKIPCKSFEGSIKKMQLLSNNICYAPEPDTEVEQLLTIRVDGRVYLTVHSLAVDRYVTMHKKQLRISKVDAGYILANVALYFSRINELSLATDIGTWELIITNDEGTEYKYKGTLHTDLWIEGQGLSELIRRMLGMPELLCFDGYARVPIEKKDNEYIFVNVSFDGSDRTYCYLTDDPLIRKGDMVEVTVKNNDIEWVEVVSVEVHTAEDAPYPIEKCKKIIQII